MKLVCEYTMMQNACYIFRFHEKCIESASRHAKILLGSLEVTNVIRVLGAAVKSAFSKSIHMNYN